MSMTVNSKSARKCCKDCDSDYGHSKNGKAKTQLRRTIRHRDKEATRRDRDND